MKLVTSDGTEYPIKQAETTLGSAPGNDIRLDDDKVSGQHAVIRQEGDSFILHDLDSTGGSFVDEIQVHDSHPLKPGDQLWLGDTLLIVRSGVATHKRRVSQWQALAGMILGILSILWPLFWLELMSESFFWNGFFVGLTVDVLGVILSAVSLRTPRRKWMAIVGLVASILGLPLWGYLFFIRAIFSFI